MRWKGRRVCLLCSYRTLYLLSSGHFKCRRCKHRFKDFTGTHLGRVRVPLDELTHVLYMFVLGVPAYRSRWYVRSNLDTVKRLFRLIRLAIYDGLIQYLKKMELTGEIEIDEALFGGHRKGKHGWGAEGKSLVFGIYQRDGKVITFPVSDRKNDTLIPLITQHTKKGSLYYSDDHIAYATLNLIGKHHVIPHQRQEYVKEETHINGIEGFWSYAKTWLYHYRGVPKQYFHLYLKEIEFRFNNRDRDLFPLVAEMLVK
jgi:transposase